MDPEGAAVADVLVVLVTVVSFAALIALVRGIDRL
jgi:hypothetical protein